MPANSMLLWAGHKWWGERAAGSCQARMWFHGYFWVPGWVVAAVYTRLRDNQHGLVTVTRRPAGGTAFPLRQESPRVSLQNTTVAQDAFVSVKFRLCTHYHFPLFPPQSCQMERDSLCRFSELLNFNQVEEDNALHTKHCHLFAPSSSTHKERWGCTCTVHLCGGLEYYIHPQLVLLHLDGNILMSSIPLYNVTRAEIKRMHRIYTL